MGGPSASILLPRRLDAATVTRVREDVARLASHVKGDDFYVEDSLFCVSFGPDYPEELGELPETCLPEVLGWVPEDIVTFIAMRNKAADHHRLAEMCLHFVALLGGIVDFGGCLDGLPSLPRQGASAPLRVVNMNDLQGALLVASYPTANGYATAHYGDAEFLRAWMHHPNFHMVK